jgi:Flp pilus assembly protein TadD
MFQRILSSGAVLMVGLIVAGCSSDQSSSSFNPLKGFPLGSQNSGQAEKPASRDTASNGKNAGGTNSGNLAMARLAERRGQMDHARELYGCLLKRDPNNPVLSHRLGVIHAREGRFEEADASFRRALALKPDDPGILRDLGYSYYLQNRLEEAQGVLEKALQFEPYDEAICNNLALIYGEQGRYDLCLAMFHRTCDDARSYANLAFVYTQQGDLDSAKAMYSRALTLDKNLRPAAEGLVQLAQFESRRSEFAQMAKRQPGSPASSVPGYGREESAAGAAPAANTPPQVGQVSFQSSPPAAQARD